MQTFLIIPVFLVAASAASAQGQQVPGAHFIENWDLDGDGRVTQAELTEKRSDIFYMFDQNEDGTLDGGEYDLFDETRRADIDANAGGRRGPMVKVDRAMARDFNDADGDGAVSAPEFEKKSAEVFEMLDFDKDGAITTDDFAAMRQGG